VEEAVWDDFDTRANCVHVCDADAVRLYFEQLPSALAGLSAALARRPGAAESAAIADLLPRLIATYRLLALRYRHDRAGDGLRIDTTNSGFFHFSTLLDVEVDVSSAARVLAPLPPAAQLRRELAEHIVRHAALPREPHEQLARRAYLEALQPERLWSDFVPGPLVPLPASATPAWFWSFGTYDRILNRPFIYMMYLVPSAPGRTPSLPRERTRLEEAARRLACGKLPLLAFARQLDDQELAATPQLVRRLAVGPWFSSSFTENPPAIARLFEPFAGRHPHLLQWEVETLLSDHEQRVGAGLLSAGRVQQVWWLPRDRELHARGVSHLERGVLLPHWLAQHAAELFADQDLWTLDASGAVHHAGTR